MPWCDWEGGGSKVHLCLALFIREAGEIQHTRRPLDGAGDRDYLIKDPGFFFFLCELYDVLATGTSRKGTCVPEEIRRAIRGSRTDA